MFQRFCILTKGQEKAVEASMGEVVKAKAGGEIPADKLAERTGIKATRAWAFRAGESHQQLLVTLSPGICALHLSEGDKGTLQREFKNLSDAMATALKGKLRQIDTKKTDKAEYTAYAVDVPNVPNEPILALSSAVGDAPSGTKHLLTFSIIKKSQE